MISSGFTDIEQLYELFNEESDVKDTCIVFHLFFSDSTAGAEDLEIGPEGVEIEFCDVTFTYPKRSKSGRLLGSVSDHEQMISLHKNRNNQH